MSDGSGPLATPFRGPEEFRFVDEPIFKEREEDVWYVLQLITLYRGVAVYGESGTGKSSLVNAGVLPELVRKGYTVDRVRVQPNFEAEFLVERISQSDEGTAPFLTSGLVEDAGGPKAVPFSCEAFLAALKTGGAGKRRFLVFDQFEEVVTRFSAAPTAAGPGAQKARTRIAETIEAILHSEELRVKTMFVFREDYIAPIRDFLLRCPEVLRQYHWLRPPGTDKTSRIITGPLELPQFQDDQRRFSTALVAELVLQLNSRADAGYVSLTDLQIACLELWRSPDPESKLRERKVAGVIQGYLQRALATLADAGLREAAVALLGTMVTGRGTRNIVSEYDAISRVRGTFGEFTEDKFKEALGLLVSTRLVRRSLEGEAAYYEIVSEFLGPWILDHRAQQESEAAYRSAVRAVEKIQRQSRTRLYMGLALILIFCVVGVLLVRGAGLAARLQESQQQIAKLQSREAQNLEVLRTLGARKDGAGNRGGTVFGSDTLEVVIGVAFVLLLLSLLVATLNELIASFLDLRAKHLKEGITRLLGERQLGDLPQKLFSHPLIGALSMGDRFPSYIPPRTFAMALVDLVGPAPGFGLALEDLRVQITKLPDGDVRRNLLLMAYQSPSLDGFWHAIEVWYSNAMAAVSSVYKRGVQLRLVLIGACLAIALNVDTLDVINNLASSSPSRAAFVATAQSYAQELASGGEQARLDQLQKAMSAYKSDLILPIGWYQGSWVPGTGTDWFRRVLGWLITVIAVSVLAQFWFDILNRFSAIRLAVKPGSAAWPEPPGRD